MHPVVIALVVLLVGVVIAPIATGTAGVTDGEQRIPGGGGNWIDNENTGLGHQNYTGADSGSSGDQSENDARIVEVYPNPPTYGDPGEFVTVWFPDGVTPDKYALADDHVEVDLPQQSSINASKTSGKRLTYSTAPAITRTYTNRTVRPLSDQLQLADRGDTIRLLENGSLIDSVTYSHASEASVYDASTNQWRPLGATDLSIVTETGGTVEPFVLPDEPDRASEFLESGSDRILVAGYTLSSRRVVQTLVDAHERGVEVEVLVDGSPVGGMSGQAAAALDVLDRAGIEVSVLDGDRARYRFHHAKYAVVDDRALVTSENWKPAGTGGKSSRGWAVITDQQPIVDGLVETYRADTGWVDAIPWQHFEEVTLVDDDRAEGKYPTAFDSVELQVTRTELLLAPDNAEKRVLEVIEDADESLDIKQVQISDWNFPFLQAVVAAAERGVNVRILLSGAWYAEEENERLARWLREQAAVEELPLEVRINDPGEEFDQIHAKGLIVDEEQVLVGSINWNNNSVRHNREVALLLSGTEPARYFTDVFEADWRHDEDDGFELPVGLAIAGLVAGVGAILVANRLRFDPASVPNSE